MNESGQTATLPAPESPSGGPAQRRRAYRLGAFGLGLGVAVTTGVLVLAHGPDDGSIAMPPVVLGESLEPLQVYETFSVPSGVPAANQMKVPLIKPSGKSVALSAEPVAALHVQYARVRYLDFRKSWEIEFVASDDAQLQAYADRTSGPQRYSTLVDGKAVVLGTEIGDPTGINYFLWNLPTRDLALSIAHSLTTQVSEIPTHSS